MVHLFKEFPSIFSGLASVSIFHELILVKHWLLFDSSSNEEQEEMRAIDMLLDLLSEIYSITSIFLTSIAAVAHYCDS